MFLFLATFTKTRRAKPQCTLDNKIGYNVKKSSICSLARLKNTNTRSKEVWRYHSVDSYATLLRPKKEY